MVEASVADIIGSAITTDYPLAAFYQVVVKRLQFSADGATLLCSSGDERLQLCGCHLALVRIIFCGNPFVCGCHKLSGNTFLCLGVVEQLHDALFHLLVTQSHTQTKLAEVLEQGVVESGALSLGVLGVRSRGNGG